MCVLGLHLKVIKKSFSFITRVFPCVITSSHWKRKQEVNKQLIFLIFSAWSEEGCEIRKTNETHTVCECNHLTNFTVLMDVHAVRLDIAHQVALQIITYIGCIISVVCLVLAILTFQLFRGLKVINNLSRAIPSFAPVSNFRNLEKSCFSFFQSDRTTIHKNLCVCLLIAEILFVCGIGQTNQRIVCGIVAGLLHFFFLCAFAWMFLEGIYTTLFRKYYPLHPLSFIEF